MRVSQNQEIALRGFAPQRYFLTEKGVVSLAD